jgi:hypothetical protein
MLTSSVATWDKTFLNPPSVEGWHTGQEWIDSGGLVKRVNFVAGQFGDIQQPGIRSIVDAILSKGPELNATSIVDGCLELMGHLQLHKANRQHLIEHINHTGGVFTDTSENREKAARKVLEVITNIGTSREFQFI